MELMNPQKESESKNLETVSFLFYSRIPSTKDFLGSNSRFYGRIRSSSSKKMCRTLNELDYLFLKQETEC